MLDSLSHKLNGALKKLAGQNKLTASNISEAMDDVRTALLEADVQYDLADAFCDRVEKQALGTKILESVQAGQMMVKIVHDELVRLLGGEEAVEKASSGEAYAPETATTDPIPLNPDGSLTIVLMAGLQGSGKTTTCGKLATLLKKRGRKTVLAAIDLQRPAAVTQLEILAEQAGQQDGDGEVLFYGEADKCAEYGKAVGVAVDVARRAVKFAKSQNADVLILDTAGRLHISDDLMGELRQIMAATMPKHIYLVVDSMTGQDAVKSTKAFNERLEISGAILTKFDSDTRGGAALTLREVTGKPIRFVGVSEKLDGLEAFHPTRVAGRILGMGDVVSLVEKAQEAVSEAEAKEMEDKIRKGEMSLDDFLDQFRKMRRMGPLKQILGMLPGVGSMLKDLPIDEKQMDRTEAIVSSMTALERRDPSILDNSRRRRIARGSGSKPEDVSRLVKGFNATKQMMGAMGGGMPAGGGMPSNPQAMMDAMRGAKKNKPKRAQFKKRR